MKHISRKRALVLAGKYEGIRNGIREDIKAGGVNDDFPRKRAGIPPDIAMDLARAADTLNKVIGQLLAVHNGSRS